MQATEGNGIWTAGTKALIGLGGIGDGDACLCSLRLSFVHSLIIDTDDSSLSRNQCTRFY